MDNLEKMDDDALALQVSLRRGCIPAADLIRPNGIPYCPCPGSPHGVPAQQTPAGVVFMPPRLHKFPRDVMIQFLRHVPQPGSKNFDGVTVMAIKISRTGQPVIEENYPPHLQNLGFALMMRGALKQVDEKFRDRIEQKKMAPPKSDIDALLDEAQGEEDFPA